MTCLSCCVYSNPNSAFVCSWREVAFRLAVCWLIAAGIFSLSQANAASQDAPPPSPSSEDVSILSEGHTYSGTTDQIFHFQVRADSTVMLSNGPDGTSIVVPVSLFKLINDRINIRLFESRMDPGQLNVGLEDRALHLRLIQRYDLLFLGGAGTGLVLLVGISTWLGIRLRRSRLAQRALRKRYQLLQEGEERERRRLAREIHDGPVQALHGLHLQVVGMSMSQHTETMARGDGQSVSPANTSSLLSTDLMNVTRELRAISEGLHPASLERFGLVAALHSHARRLSNLSETSQQEKAPSIHVEGPEDLLDLSDTERLALYRMGQEAVTNAVHHASATSIDIRAWKENQTACLVISDDGCGFDADSPVASQARTASDSNGLGLIGIKERAAMIGASVTVDSICGTGTTVSIRIPNQK